MECFCERFRQAAADALNEPNIVVGTIALGGGDFIQDVKKREDVEILEVTLDNRNALPGLILKKIEGLRKSQQVSKDN